MHEELIEEGIVLKSNDGIAEIALLENDNCEECSAKLFCKPQEGETKILTVSDPLGSLPGDEVRISVEGGAVLKATLLLYGLPLLLLILGILLGMNLFTYSKLPELYSFFFGLSLTAVYFGIVYFFSIKKGSSKSLPKIVFVKKRS